MCSSSGSEKSDSREKKLYGVSWPARSADIALMSLLGSLHFLGSLDRATTWGVGLASVYISVAWTPSEACDRGAIRNGWGGRFGLVPSCLVEGI